MIKWMEWKARVQSRDEERRKRRKGIEKWKAGRLLMDENGGRGKKRGKSSY